jgi:Asp-tRNA(Asn)/Glu-tRNA(Gln) amidotransferase C subunit
LVNSTRPDKIIDYGYSPADLLKNVPNVQEQQIKVKRILE